MKNFDYSLVLGIDVKRPIDAIFVNSPLRDYKERPKFNDFTLPVLGLGYIATYAEHEGFNVGLLDAEAHGLSIEEIVSLLNTLQPRWWGMNLLAPTYEVSARIASKVDPDIKLLLGGHQAKAMPLQILQDPRMLACRALVLGEGEVRVTELLKDINNREKIPGVMWVDDVSGEIRQGKNRGVKEDLAPDVDTIPFVDRKFFSQDPLWEQGRWESNIVGARGCPYNCSFCGAAVSANPDITIRARTPDNIIAEMNELRELYNVTAFRFVDDLFLGVTRVIKKMLDAFEEYNIGEWAVWDATGRINILDKLSDADLDRLKSNGLREVALGIESGSERILKQIDKRVDPDMTKRVLTRLLDRGINVKGYFILGFPTETTIEIDETVSLIEQLWEVTDERPGVFRCSVFEYRPYPGTPDWNRLMQTGKYSEKDLLNYSSVDLTSDGLDESMRERDEFNFSVNVQLSEAPIEYVRKQLVYLSKAQYARKQLSVNE